MRKAKTKSLPFGSMSIDTNFKDSFLSENPDIRKCTEEEKLAFSLGISPGAVFGALLGAGVASKAGRKASLEYQDRLRIMNTKPQKKKYPSIQSGYYSQAQNLAKNLRVVFTPVSAVYLVKNGTNDVAIETIDVEKMDNVMHNAWENKNQDFFKNMLLNKMMMEVNLAEKIFAKNMIANQQILSDNIAKRAGIAKKASFGAEDDLCGYIDAVLKMREYYEDSESHQKVAAVLEQMTDMNKDAIVVKPELGNEPEKYAALGKVKDVFGINANTSKIRSLKKRLENPAYLKRHLQIGFFPDRVSFIVDNTLITTLSVFDMNHKGFNAFKSQDQKYFKRLFNRTIKSTGKKEGMAKTAEEVNPIQKLINIPRATAFRMNEIHPYVYDRILSRKYGKEWNNNELSVLIKRIEMDFKLNETGIPDIPLNKVMSAYTLLSNDTINAFTSSLAFEKIARSFNDLPIDFLTAESEGLGIGEIAFALECYNSILMDRGVDAYELFSDEVTLYIADVLLDKDIVILYPDLKNQTDAYIEFYGDLNRKILDKLIERNNLSEMENKDMDVKSARQNEILQPLTLQVLTAIRSKEVSSDLAPEYIDRICEENEFDMNKSSLLRRQIQLNLNTDEFLETKRKAAKTQLELFRLI